MLARSCCSYNSEDASVIVLVLDSSRGEPLSGFRALQATPLQAGFSDPNRFWLQRSKIEDEDEFKDENEFKDGHIRAGSRRDDLVLDPG